MPLIKSPSKAAVSSNVSEMIKSGFPRKQALAASLSNARKYGAKFAEGGPIDPFNKKIGVEMIGGGPARIGGGGGITPANRNFNQKEFVANLKQPSIEEKTWNNYGRHMEKPDDVLNTKHPMQGALWGSARDIAERTGMSEAQAFSKVVNHVWQQMGANRYMSPEAARRYLNIERGRAGGISAVEKKRGGAINRARGYAQGGPSYFEKNAMRSLTRGSMLHSDVPGRTDKIPLNLPSGSYVLPADYVSSKGQNNSIAGGKAIGDEIAAGKIRAPKLPKIRTPKLRKPKLGGFAKGGPSPKVPIIAAGGERIVSPEEVREIGRGDMDHGHNYLDKLVMKERKKHIKTLQKLKPPKKR